MSMHAANLRSSERLQKVLDFLKNRGTEGATTMEIVKGCGVCAVNSIIAELRQNGYTITCKQGNVDGARVARYKLIVQPSVAPGVAG